MMIGMDLTGLAVAALCAVMVGISKTGIPGFGILIVPLMAMALPARQSTGALLGILILADLFAVSYYHRNALWGHIVRLIPATLVGIVAGYFVMKFISDEQLKPVIGVIVLAMLVVNWRRNHGADGSNSVPSQWWFAVVMGFLAGLTTMMANAAGPVMIVYLLAMRLPKIEFVGTSAWFFFIVNWLKVPFSAQLGLITPESIKFNLCMLPFIVAGAILGIFALKKMPQRIFEITIQVLAAAAAAKLLLWPTVNWFAKM
ncbi:MAG: sulfite exporter TauE/SafE family protein [Planctomycetota bacterium]